MEAKNIELVIYFFFSMSNVYSDCYGNTYASATCEQPTSLGNEPLHIGEALLPKVERDVNDVCHKTKC